MAQKMMTYFNDFLKNIRLTENQVSELKAAHTTLRRRLEADEDLKDIVDDVFPRKLSSCNGSKTKTGETFRCRYYSSN